MSGERPVTDVSRRQRTSRAAGLLAAGALAAGVLAGCSRPPRRASEVLPNHIWRTTNAAGGPSYRFRPGQQAELMRGTTIFFGTYQFPTDSALVLRVSGLIPGMPTPGPTELTLRYDVRVLPNAGGRERVEFRAGTAVDTLARVD